MIIPETASRPLQPPRPIAALVTNIYIDGFNLYYGALKNTPHRWLDIDALCRRLLLPKDHDIAAAFGHRPTGLLAETAMSLLEEITQKARR